MKHNRLYLIILALFSAFSLAQAASFRVQAPSQVEQGSNFKVEFILDGADGANPSIPQLDGVQLLVGPEVYTRMSSSIINGHASSNYSKVITMIYQAVTPGKHTLPSATIEAEGRTLSTQPVTIEILPMGNTPAPAPVQPSAPSQSNAPSTSVAPSPSQSQQFNDVKDKDFFIKIILSKDVVYEQEAVVCTIKIYSQHNVSHFQCTRQPSFNGFLIEELPVSNNTQYEEVNGERYVSAVLKKCILYPQESGTLTITSGNYDVQLLKYDSLSDPFWGFSQPTPVDIKVSSNSASVNIRPLPSPRPANFSGAVGEFSVITRLKPSSFKTYAPATYSIIVSGSGNLKYIQNPIVQMPKQFDTYDPQNAVNMSPMGDNVSGSVTFDYLFIPQFVGEYKIPDSYFVYFNTETQHYDSIRVEGYNLKVEKGEGKPSEHYKLSNMDIRDINKSNSNLSKSQSFFINSPLYWIAALLSIIALVAGLIIYKKMEKTRSNSKLMRTRRASKLAQRRLKTAHALMVKNDRNGFYTETLSALWGYLSDKLSIPVSELSKENITAEMAAYGFSQQHIDETMQMLETCEFAQYAPELSSGNMEQVYNDSAMLIDKLESVKRSNTSSNINMKSFLLTIALVATLSLQAVAAPVDLVEQGNKAYDAKQYNKAIELYEQALKNGSSSQLYYNLGNAYYRNNNRAKAILSYERALKLSPSNSDARYNLEFINEKSQLLNEDGSSYFSSLLGNLVSHASSNAWAVIAFLALLLCLAGIACYRIADTVSLQKLGFFGAIAMAVITVFAVSCAIYMFNRSTSRDYAIIMVDKTPVNKSPHGGDKDVAFTLRNGVKVEIVDSITDKAPNKKWYKVSTHDERTGWIAPANFEII